MGPFSFAAQWRRDALRTSLWLVPSVLVVLAGLLFVLTDVLDHAAYNGRLALPSWVISPGADAARQILTTLAAAVITVVGVVFSIMIVTLTLASTQFGPRMLRNFIRDRGTKVTLGTFVATFIYALLALVVIAPGPHGDFIPKISIMVTLALVVIDVGVLIYFIHHIATTIQLPNVIAAIAADLLAAIDVELHVHNSRRVVAESGPSVVELELRLQESDGVLPASRSGYLQFVRHDTLVRIATLSGAVIRLDARPGHFVVAGHPIGAVWPPDAAPSVARELERAHIAGPNRTLTQDVAFAVDQLVEIAIRALSPAVNDTFTALTCIDWLDSLCHLARRWEPDRIHRDHHGYVRVITSPISYRRLVERAFEKIRQASDGMPAVMIRQLVALIRIMESTRNEEQREVLLEEAAAIDRASVRTIAEPADLADVRRRYDILLAAHARLAERD